MARAMTYIDADLIDEANETAAPKRTMSSGEIMRRLYSMGVVAACAVLAIGIMFFSKSAAPGVLLYGESISAESRCVTEYMPRSIIFSVEPHAITEISIPLELNFSKKTELSVVGASMIILNDAGECEYEGTSYEVSGKVSICLVVPADKSAVVIETNRNYNIVLTLDAESSDWYVHIDKNN